MKCSERHHEGREDRDGEDLVGNGDAGEGDHRHPEQIEDRDHDADRFRAEPVEPAEREFALLLAGQAARAAAGDWRQCLRRICKPP